MTQEEKQLLLKDLSARLPYGFTIHRYSDNRDIIFEQNELDEFAHFLEYSEGKEFKPYLRPMSSMTEEEKNELNSISYEFGDEWFDAETTEEKYMASAKMQSRSVDFYNAHHIDYHGLISIGLALEAPKGMY